MKLNGAAILVFRASTSLRAAPVALPSVRRRRLQLGSDERAIREVHSIWINAVNAGDLVRLLTLMTDDAVFLNPGQAPFGRDGFSPGFSAAHQQARINCTSELEEVVVVGEVAYTLSRDSLSVTPRAGGEAMQLAGHRMTVSRQVDATTCDAAFGLVGPRVRFAGVQIGDDHETGRCRRKKDKTATAVNRAAHPRNAGRW
jgi:uncharacterized protein (TIGR02246 family)